MNEDPRFVTNHERMHNLPALEEALNAVFRQRTTEDWLAALEEAGVPAGPVLTVNEMHEDPQALAREMIVETEHPVAGMTKALGLPVKFSETPGGIERPAPLLGQHSAEVLAEGGYDQAAIDAMIASGAVIVTDPPA